MCGIVAIVSSTSKVRPSQIDAMRDSMVHRGPDDGGTWVFQSDDFSVGLGAQRLSIVDLSCAGSMPMTNEDERVCIVYNGEVYNHLGIRADLEKKGHRYRSRTDTESVLHAYEEYGLSCFARLNGMFACVIYDGRHNRIVIARDRTGVKPLYYFEHHGTVVFASELKTLIRTGYVPTEIDPTALDVYLALGYVPAPYSLIKGVRKLTAGSYGVYEKGHLKIETYWRPSMESSTPTLRPWAQAVAETRFTVTEAIERQMMSDVPVGVMLSGGLDSTIIATIAQKSSSVPLHTFSIGFETRRSGLEPIYNFDRGFARQVADSLGTVHHEIVATDDGDLEQQLRQLVIQLDEPVWEPSFLSIYLMSKLARDHGVKVLLSGDGSDELFGGYPWHPALNKLEQFERLPGLRPALAVLARLPLTPPTRAKVHDLRRKYRRDDVTKYHAQYDIFDAPGRARLFGRSLRDDPLDQFIEPLLTSTHAKSLTDRFALAEFVLWVGEHFNQRLDRMTMAASVEGRVPFQDNAVVELALATSSADKLRGGSGKAVLRQAFRDHVPSYVIQRAKRPFAAPATAWMHGALRPLVSQLLSSDSLARLPVADPGILARSLVSSTQGPQARQEQIWSLLHLTFWVDSLSQTTVEAR